MLRPDNRFIALLHNRVVKPVAARVLKLGQSYYASTSGPTRMRIRRSGLSPMFSTFKVTGNRVPIGSLDAAYWEDAISKTRFGGKNRRILSVIVPGKSSTPVMPLVATNPHARMGERVKNIMAVRDQLRGIYPRTNTFSVTRIATTGRNIGLPKSSTVTYTRPLKRSLWQTWTKR